MMSLFPENPNDTEYNLSQIPCSWRVFHILLCFTGVSNVFFVKQLPRWLRVGSLIYHVAWFCLLVPTFVLLMHNFTWGRSIDHIVHHIGLIIYGNYSITLGIAHMINALNSAMRLCSPLCASIVKCPPFSWWRHQMETFSALLAICPGNSPVSGEFPAQRPVTRSFDIFFDLRLNKRLSKHSWGWWFETLSCPLWRQCHVVGANPRG